MNILLIGLVIGVVAIIGFSLVAKGLINIFQIILNCVSASKSAMINLLGRRNLGFKACIPDVLIDVNSQSREFDHERIVLARYAPKAYIPLKKETKLFHGTIKAIYEPLPEPLLVMNINNILNMRNMSISPSFMPLFAILIEKEEYPIPPPEKPQTFIQPPSWAPKIVEISEPTLVLPLYTERFSFLNKYVYLAHKEEISLLEAARLRKTEIEELIRNRNMEMMGLEKRAFALKNQAEEEQEKAFSNAMTLYTNNKKAYLDAFNLEQSTVRSIYDSVLKTGADGLISRIDLTMRTMTLPLAISRDSESRFDSDSGVLIHEHCFPDLSEIEWVKFVEQKIGYVSKPANQKECKEASKMLWPVLCLRLACEIARLDSDGILKAIAVNGWAEYTEKATGQRKRAYCASLFATKEQIASLNLDAIDPEAAFNGLKGIAAHSLEITPINPIIRLNTNDPRFVDAKEILANMSMGENIAAMDWEDFEHLCRELFERAFASSGAEVKITQASRDQGVDAIIFDPDPLRGGKIVIQAKRYTNLVDVSAVRDLYGAVINEGAIKGILVTTSYFGPDAYTFAKDKPLTLLAGRELLGLLEQYGYKFRIDLMEAKRILAKQ